MDNENNANTVDNVYPDFVPNQVLTNHQLNQLRAYLDQQNRLGRVRLTGTGIVCGLNITLSESDDATKSDVTLSISNGFAISSAGYVLEQKAIELTHWRQYQDPDTDKEKGVIYKTWQQKTDTANTKKQRDILELVSKEDASGDNSLQKLTTQQFKDNDDNENDGRVLVLYLEKNSTPLDSCLVTDCDSKGVNVQLIPRVLLVEKTALTAIEPCESARNQMLHIPRLHTVLQLSTVEDREQITQAYQKLIQQSLESIQKNIDKAYQRYETVLNLDKNLLGNLNNLHQLFEFPQQYQYAWDILNDIVVAYNEFIQLACTLITPCLATYKQAFPRHIMLAAMDGDTGYRHEFIPSVVHNVAHHDVEQARKLFMRILKMAGSIQLQHINNTQKEHAIKITPSHTALYPLGKRALPFYYTAELEPFWQPQMCCTTEDVWSYHFQPKNEEEDRRDFAYTHSSFMRIEGHIGKNCDQASKIIRHLQHYFNLEFDLVTLPIQQQKKAIDIADGDRLPIHVPIERLPINSITSTEMKDSLASLATDIAGIEHTAGVVKGGTFILVCDAERQVIADFSLVGKIPCCRYQVAPQPVKLGSIRGRFIDEVGSALSGGQVMLKHIASSSTSKVITDNKANYHFPNLVAGNYILKASISFGENEDMTAIKEVSLAAGEHKTNVDLIGQFVHVAQDGVIKGRVVAENGHVAPNANVILQPGNQQQKSDPEGRFTFTDLKPDHYTLQATFKHIFGAGSHTIKTEPVPVKLLAGGEAIIELIFKQNIAEATTGGLIITLINASTNKKLTTANVTIQHETLQQISKTLTKSNHTATKSFQFLKIATGRYTVKVKASGFFDNAIDGLNVTANKTTQKTIRLTKRTVVIQPDRPISGGGRRPIAIDRPIVVNPALTERFRPMGTDDASDGLSIEERQEAAKAMYSQRFAHYQQLFTALPTMVKRSLFGKATQRFLTETVVNEVSDSVIMQQYRQISRQGLQVQRNRNTATANKPHYQRMLVLLSLGFLDSLMMSHPMTLDAEAKEAISSIGGILRRAKISRASFNEQWNGQQLKDELLLGSTDAVNTLLKN